MGGAFVLVLEMSSPIEAMTYMYPLIIGRTELWQRCIYSTPGFFPPNLLIPMCTNKIACTFITLGSRLGSVCTFQQNEELRRQLTAQQKLLEKHKSNIEKSIAMTKTLLKEKVMVITG